MEEKPIGARTSLRRTQLGSKARSGVVVATVHQYPERRCRLDCACLCYQSIYAVNSIHTSPTPTDFEAELGVNRGRFDAEITFF